MVKNQDKIWTDADIKKLKRLIKEGKSTVVFSTIEK